MIELSSATSSTPTYSSPSRTVCSTTNSSTVVPSTRLRKYSCQDIEKLKQKYRIQHTSCFTHLQTLINKHRISKCRECAYDEQCRICLECSLCLCRHHAQQHAKTSSHPLAIDIKRLFVHCYVCGDVQYDTVFERARRKMILSPQNSPSTTIEGFQSKSTKKFSSFFSSRDLWSSQSGKYMLYE